MTKLQRLIDKTFGDEKLYDDFVEYLNENERYIEDKWTTKTGWIDYLNDLFGFNLRDTEEEKMILNSIIKDRIPLFKNEVYEYDYSNNTYNKIKESEIEWYLIESKNYDIVKDFKKSHQGSLIVFLKEKYESIYDEMLENKKWIDSDIEGPLLNDISSDYGNFLDDSLKSIIEDIISNEKLGDHAWFEVDGNWNSLIEVDEKDVKEKLIDYISNSKKWKQRLNYLKNEKRWKFRDFNEYLDNKLDNILEKTNSR